MASHSCACVSVYMYAHVRTCVGVYMYTGMPCALSLSVSDSCVCVRACMSECIHACMCAYVVIKLFSDIICLNTFLFSLCMHLTLIYNLFNLNFIHLHVTISF